MMPWESWPARLALMQPAAARLAAALVEVPIRAPAVPVITNVDAEPNRDGGQDAIPESEGEGQRDQLDETDELKLDGAGAAGEVGEDGRGDEEARQGRARQLFAYAGEGRYQIEWVDDEEGGKCR